MAFRAASASNPASLAPPSSIGSVLDSVDSSLVATLEIAGSIEKAAAHFRRSAVMGPGDNRSSETDAPQMIQSIRCDPRLQQFLWPPSTDPTFVSDIEYAIAQFTIDQIDFAKADALNHVNSLIQNDFPDSDLIQLCEELSNVVTSNRNADRG